MQLWYALGKLKSEKVAWRMAQESGLKLATICSALITGPNFHRRNSTPTMAYLKGRNSTPKQQTLSFISIYQEPTFILKSKSFSIRSSRDVRKWCASNSGGDQIGQGSCLCLWRDEGECFQQIHLLWSGDLDGRWGGEVGGGDGRPRHHHAPNNPSNTLINSISIVK